MPENPVPLLPGRARLGFIGLGIMGRPMARNLVAAGYDLVVHDLNPAATEELAERGAKRASSPAEVASLSHAVITMLPDTPDLEAVVGGEGGLAGTLPAGSLLLDMSTVDPIATRRIAQQFIARGVSYVDAPVSGGQQGAIEGTLSIMAGGTDDDIARASPILEVLGRTIVHVGDVGAGQVAKAANQLVVGATIEAVAEALALAQAAGVDPTKVRAALLGGFAASRVLEVHGQRMLDGNFTPGFRVRLHLKDARIAARTASQLGITVPGLESALHGFEQLVAAGHEDLDHSALFLRVRPAEGH